MSPKAETLRRGSEWIEKAAQLPVRFAQVREDPLIDLWLLKHCPPGARIIMVASGGCTAAFLAGSGLSRSIRLVDPNSAQLALTHLKLRLLRTKDRRARLRILGHLPMDPAERRMELDAQLSSLTLAAEHLGPPETLYSLGPDHVGRYEFLFASLRAELKPWQGELESLLRLRDPAEQARLIAPGSPLRRSFKTALAQIMALPILVRLFGKAATGNRRKPFSRHFADQLQNVLETLPAATNPYLAQILAGRYRGTLVPWLSVPCPRKFPRLEFVNSDMSGALESSLNEFDLVHLSNILDWLAPEEASKVLELSMRSLRPKGFIIVRQLNSTLDLRALGKGFRWLDAEAAPLLKQDRSFFYRDLLIGQKN